ncbi:MAG: YjjG family noncanonical pyrimidine nucleotidase [Clostridia bacterium]|nr:YjjG family noncanonical pyrimidine nucleotidase [Clostridia bacterium]
MIKKIMLDIDDTILDFHLSESIAIRKALTSLGIDVTDEIIATYSAINKSQWEALERGEIERKVLLYRRFEILFELLGVSLSGNEAQRRYETALGKESHYLEGAEEMLEALSKTYELYAASNGISKVQRPRIESAGLERYFKDIFISEEIGYNKPSVEFFDVCLERMGSPKRDEVLIFGDSLTSDILGGINAKIRTCHFDPKGRGVYEKITPDYSVSSYSEFLKLLESIE